VATLKQSLAEATQRVKHMELEQEQFFEDVQEMKTQFDRLSDAHRKVLWEYLPARDVDMRAIPLLSLQIEETPTRVGRYPLEQVLGYGQYAVVYSSSLPGDAQPLAVKAIDKDKVVDLVSLHRINSEIASLSDPAIQHPCILALKDVIHTKKHVYLVTERGGKDLFEYFGAHQMGLDEDIIKPLMFRVAQAVQVLHHHNYCHRDLKP
jgi:serine/threonine protein kinase